MNFLIINGKIQMSNGKPITVPDDYNGEPIMIDGKLLKSGGQLVGYKWNRRIVASDGAICSNNLKCGTRLP